MTDEFTNWLIITYDQVDGKFLRVHTLEELLQLVLGIG